MNMPALKKKPFITTSGYCKTISLNVSQPGNCVLLNAIQSINKLKLSL